MSDSNQTGKPVLPDLETPPNLVCPEEKCDRDGFPSSNLSFLLDVSDFFSLLPPHMYEPLADMSFSQFLEFIIQYLANNHVRSNITVRECAHNELAYSVTVNHSYRKMIQHMLHPDQTPIFDYGFRTPSTVYDQVPCPTFQSVSDMLSDREKLMLRKMKEGRSLPYAYGYAFNEAMSYRTNRTWTKQMQDGVNQRAQDGYQSPPPPLSPPAED